MGDVTSPATRGAPALSLIIPCCNEEAGFSALEVALLPVLDELATHGSVEVILVDDGSTDGTWDAITRLAARVPGVHPTRHPHNYGLGAALRTGFALARGEVIVTTDADGTYPFAEIPGLLARLTPGTDIVTASPYHPEGGVDGVPAWRLVFSRSASLCYRAVLRHRGSTVHTYTSLFRAYRRAVLPYVTPDHEGFLAVAEILTRGMLAGFTVVEYPTVLHARRFGQSKARVARITLAHLQFLTLLLLNRVRVRRPDTVPSPQPHIAAREAAGD